MDTPLARYRADLERNDFSYDESQEAAVLALESVFQALIEVKPQKKASWVASVFKKQDEKERVKGLYFWGGVGRGKTYLMDTFFEAIPFPEKRRLHFHHFMRLIHEQLKVHKGKANPLELVAKSFASEVRVLCFDEFFVSDIGDAVILANLLGTLFEEGVTLIATSNIEPDGLYKNGLQRKLFLPAIELLKQNTHILNVDGGTDYRLRTLKQVEIFHSPLDEKSRDDLRLSFDRLAPDTTNVEIDIDIDVIGRPIRAQRLSDDVALFSFSELCEGPRSQNDYIELARLFHAVLIQGVPQFIGTNDDAARRFVNLVDEFYDRNVKLLLTAEAPITELYQDGRLGFEFKRTVSRLQEMQSEEYLSAQHKA